MMVDNDFPTAYANFGDVAQGTSPVNEDLYNWMRTFCQVIKNWTKK